MRTKGLRGYNEQNKVKGCLSPSAISGRTISYKDKCLDNVLKRLLAKRIFINLNGAKPISTPTMFFSFHIYR